MYKKIKYIFFLIFFFNFIFFVTKYYFSSENIIFTNKSRSSYLVTGNIDKNNLPVLENDTNNIIIFKNDLEELKRKNKARSWEELIENKNE